jgi:mRNA-degrading endonuclease toxin of MazEF toxin-antitoxin module
MTKTAERFDAFDIVVVPFPYADRLAEKRRPAPVISNRKLQPSLRSPTTCAPACPRHPSFAPLRSPASNPHGSNAAPGGSTRLRQKPRRKS